MMKQYIDYLFWKRSWFRGFFVFLIPQIALWDSEGLDSPPNPFNAIPKRFRSWSEASKYLNKEIVVELDEMPNVVGRMTSIEVVAGTAYVTVAGSSMQFLYWRCRPKN
jgi:hypothetical protein